MLVVLLVFLAVFFCRDVQVLSLGATRFEYRFALYAALQMAGIGLFAAVPHGGWTASMAILIQLAEVGTALALARFVERLAWIGWILPSPVLLAALCGTGRIIGGGMGVAPATMTAIVTLGWLCVTGGLARVVRRAHCSAEDRKFIADFALMSSFTVLAFVPYGMQ